jgi:hypothetical protein
MKPADKKTTFTIPDDSPLLPSILSQVLEDRKTSAKEEGKEYSGKEKLEYKDLTDEEKTVTVPYTFNAPESDEEAIAVMREKAQKATTDKARKGWSILALVYDALDSNARSNAYQKELNKHKVSELSPERQMELSIAALRRQGIDEATAKMIIENALKANS